MRKLLSYFHFRKICYSAGQAIDFINSIDGISCTKATADIITRLFDGEQIEGLNDGAGELKVMGVIPSKVRIEDALADSLFQHDKQFNLALMNARYNQQMRQLADVHERVIMLGVIRKGWYSIEISLKLNTPHLESSSVKFMGTVYAESGMDAYDKVVQELKMDDKLAEYAICPPPISPDYKFEFISEQANIDTPIEIWDLQLALLTNNTDKQKEGISL